MAPKPCLTLLTICVSDLARSAAFYEALGFRRRARAADGVAFFDAGGVILSLWSASEMGKDAGISVERPAGFRDVSLAWNVRSAAEVDRAAAHAATAGARILRKPASVFWGGYTAYFADPDDHVWEVAYNPTFPLSDDGRLTLPD
jgi:catechol 2,3-dioxygenase-like lactoylglutathione lyase family enzyme